ncbi:MFS domain-containing protein [Fusarium falciforme]|uniref:MFS domain-containing protein n=1 Tax=Fusarium falciforme TaxID=195108 RepID=UPI0023013919|nr:MFS domain-containing protein [Fusarium falciforme]WAO90523.1 MFS domain-containing protein [Fusarium falciforme]
MSTDTDLKESDSVQDQGESGVVLPAESPSAPPSTPKDEPRIEAAIPPARFWTLSLGVLLGLFLSMIDTSIVATSLYSIGVDFEALEEVNWVALAYTLAYLGCAVVFARISDIIGRRDAFIAAYIIFFAFSLACGFSQNLEQLIAFRALQGIGGSGLYALTMIILPELSPPHLAQHIGALVGMIVALSGVLGPVLGGILTHYTTWRWVFWINGPVGFVSLVIFIFTWPKAEHLPTIERRAWKELDYFGSFLAIAAAVLVIFAFQTAGTSSDGGWKTAMFIAPLLCGLLAWGLLVGWQVFIQHRLSERFAPAFPINLFRNRVYTTAALNTLFIGFPYLLLIYAIPLRIQVVSGKSALVGGVMLLPMLGAAALGSILAGKFNSVKNYVFETLFVGSCLMTLGCGLLVTLDHAPDDAKLLGFITFCGLGFGLTVASSTMLSTIEAPIRDFAPAQGILSQMRLLGGSLGIATSSALLNQRIVEYLSGILTPFEKATIGGPDSYLSDSQWTAVRYTYSEAFRVDMKVAAGISALGVISTIGAFRKHRLLVAEQRAALVREEAARRRAQTDQQ